MPNIMSQFPRRDYVVQKLMNSKEFVLGMQPHQSNLSCFNFAPRYNYRYVEVDYMGNICVTDFYETNWIRGQAHIKNYLDSRNLHYKIEQHSSKHLKMGMYKVTFLDEFSKNNVAYIFKITRSTKA